MGTVGNVKIEPMVVTWGTDTAMVQTITCAADVSSSLNNKYFFFYVGTTKYHVWYNVAAAGSDPAPAGSIAAVVAISANATASAVATATEVVLEALTGVTSTVSGAVITVTMESNGWVAGAHEGSGSGFTFEVTTEGDTAADIGFVDGDIEFTHEEDLVDITAHETGTNVLSQIRTGKTVEVTLSFKETTVAQMTKILRAAGGNSFTPVGTGPTEVTGAGRDRDFTQTLLQAKKLVLHPKVLGSSDKSRDFTFHQAYAMLDSIAFSGENILTVPVTFKCYPKTTLHDRVEYFTFGDGSQTLT